MHRHPWHSQSFSCQLNTRVLVGVCSRHISDAITHGCTHLPPSLCLLLELHLNTSVQKYVLHHYHYFCLSFILSLAAIDFLNHVCRWVVFSMNYISGYFTKGGTLVLSYLSSMTSAMAKSYHVEGSD